MRYWSMVLDLATAGSTTSACVFRTHCFHELRAPLLPTLIGVLGLLIASLSHSHNFRFIRASTIRYYRSVLERYHIDCFDVDYCSRVL